MPRVLLNLLIFLLGMALAFFFVYRHELHTFGKNLLQLASTTQTKTYAPAEAPRNEPTGEGVALSYQREQRALLERSMSREDRQKILFKALDDGTLESLQLIRTEYLNLLPEYHEDVLPALKRHSLDNLLLRFVESDWLDWPNAQTGDSGGGPTEARLYVDDVTLVNAELGRFLETAAHLLHGMYLSMMSGLPYSLEEDLFYLLQNAEKILKHRRYTAVPARMLLEPGLVKDGLVRETIEDMRGRLWLLYLEKHPEDLTNQVKLINGLNPEFSAPAVFEAFRALLYRLALEGTPKLRAELIPMLSELEESSLFAAKDEEIRQALAEVYVIAAVDSIEGNDMEKAKELLKRSTDVLPGLKAQGVIRRFIEAPKAAVAPVEEPPAEEAPAESPQEEVEVEKPGTLSSLFSSDADEAKRGLEQVIVVLIILAVFGLIGGRILLAFLARNNVKPLPPATEPDDEEPQHFKTASTDDLEFDGLEGFDDTPDKDAINK